MCQFNELINTPKNSAWKKYCKIHPNQSDEDRHDLLLKVIQNCETHGFPVIKSISLAEQIPNPIDLDQIQIQYSEKMKCQSPLVFDILARSSDVSEYTLYYEKSNDIIDSFRANTSLCAEKLLSISQPRIVINSMISGLLKLPNQHLKTIIYSSILLNLQTSSAAENIFEPLIEEVLENYLTIIDEADLTASERLQDFFAHYISNQNFI